MAHVSKQIEHLKKDKALKKVIDTVGVIKPRKENDLYFMLLRAIAGQQLSVKAAATIWDRFLKLFKNGYPHPEQVLKLKDDKMRGVGFSYQKASYVKNIAKFSLDETLDYDILKKKNDEELIEYLVQIKGVGRWTVEMILMFSLNRLDIFPKGDLGIQVGMKKLYKIETENKKELFAEMDRIAEKWRPYRTLGCKYIWRHKDQKPV
jgi:DNA-3-methyladenine glycosylase II